jgi:hypothetical protein
MSEEQLERSILERKASDELRAIATAMSLEPVARTRKADLVNQILRAAGVEVEGTAPSHASSTASPQSPPSNGGAADSRQAAAADGASASKSARGRTSRARSTVKAGSADSLPAHAEVNANGGGPAQELGEGRDGSLAAGSALGNGKDSAASTDSADAVAEGAAAILAGSHFDRGSREPAPATGASSAYSELRSGELASNVAGGAAGGAETLDRMAGDVPTTLRPSSTRSQVEAIRVARMARAARSRQATAAGAVVADVTASAAVRSRRVAARKWHGRASSCRSVACSI